MTVRERHDAPPALFSFGTLMDIDVLLRVTKLPGEAIGLRRAMLPNHRQRQVLGESFPVVQPLAGAMTEGVLIDGLTPQAIARIRFFEGDEYRLDEIAVQLPDGTTEPARYFADTERYRVADHAWDLQTWQRTEKALFLQRIDQYMPLYGTMSATEADAYWLASASDNP